MADDLEIDSLWQSLHIGIRDVFDHREVSNDHYMDMYTHIYKYCTGTKETGRDGFAIRLGTGTTPRRRAGGIGGIGNISKFRTTFVGLDLYQRIMDFLEVHLQNLLQEGVAINTNSGYGDLLAFYQSQWERYTFSSTVLNGICAHLNRVYSRNKEALEDGAENYQIYQAALNMWRDRFFDAINDNAITVGLLEEIKHHRDGQLINETRMKDIIDSYVVLGSETANLLESYQRKFETLFFQQTETYYRTESTEFIEANTVSAYLEKAEQRLLEEERRVGTYLHVSTLPRLMVQCETILLASQVARFHSEFPELLKGNKKEDLTRLYRLIGRLDPEYFVRFREIFEETVNEEGRQELGDKVEAEPYISAILQVYNKYLTIVNEVCGKDSTFMTAFKTACTRFINSNKVTEDGKNAGKSAEFLARYFDQLLKKSEKNVGDDEMDGKLNDGMNIFVLLEDKDIFQKYYSNFLAIRFVKNISSSDDLEASMLAKLRAVHGYEYTTKLRRMYTDMTLNKNMNDDYKRWIVEKQTPNPLDIHVLVLTTLSWPFSPGPADFALPEALAPSLALFKEYYTTKHNGRVLNWIYNKSTVDIFTRDYDKRYSFLAGVVQASVILAFNEREEYTVSELMEATKLSQDYIDQILDVFCFRLKLMTCTDEKAEMNTESVIGLNKGFKSKAKTRFNINFPFKNETKVEANKTTKAVEDDRRFEVQAAIVRIMKSRKTLEHSLLVAEVIALLTNRFKPNVNLIEHCIKLLIEKLYMARDKTDLLTYHYTT